MYVYRGSSRRPSGRNRNDHGFVASTTCSATISPPGVLSSVRGPGFIAVTGVRSKTRAPAAAARAPRRRAARGRPPRSPPGWFPRGGSGGGGEPSPRGPAVAAPPAVPDDLLLHEGDLDRRVRFLQEVRGPQAREPAA